MTLSIAMTDTLSNELQARLVRVDGQEDVCIASYAVSSGANRRTFILRDVIEPRDGDRFIHGNASFAGAYVLRAATEASERGEGIALLHSHPAGAGWQMLSAQDFNTEADYHRVAQTITGLPLVGLTLANLDNSWSARHWTNKRQPVWATDVRVVGDRLRLSYNPTLSPRPVSNGSQLRTVSAWGADKQADIARLRILVVGLGSVGLDIAQRLAATGVQQLGLMDFDAVEEVNLDRMIGATRRDARHTVSKVAVAARLAKSASTATDFVAVQHECSITDPKGLAAALDYDVIFSCVDRPWARAVLNGIAYADLIPVIDGGISLDVLNDGGMRGGTWRVHTIVPGRPCMLCNGQLDISDLALDRAGLLDDEDYIRKSGIDRRPAGQNVAALAASVSAAQLAQFVSLTAHPAGIGVPAPIQYILALHRMSHLTMTSGDHCPYEAELSIGDNRTALVKNTQHWRDVVNARRSLRLPIRERAVRLLERMAERLCP